jgi:putative membrane protein
MVAWMVLGAVPMLAFGMDASKDGAFFKHAAEGGLAEVQAGMLAQDKGSSQAVKDFAARMVTDHSAANQQLQSVAAAENVRLPTDPSVRQMATYKKLQLESGDSFDKAYIRDQLKAHQQTVALFRKEIASGHDDAARQFAMATLPTIRSHLKMIRQIAADAGIKTR